jgi:Short C-terminal domain
MAKFRAQLSIWRKSEKNGKALGGFLSVGETGEITVWNIHRTTPLGTISDLVDCQIDYKQVRFRTKAEDEVILSIKTRNDADTFYKLLSAEPAPVEPVPVDQSWAGLIQKLADLRDAGLLTDEEFATKKAEILRRV